LPEPPRKPEDANWLDLGVGLAIGDLDQVDGGKHAKPLRGRKIEHIVSGARSFEGVSSFGGLRSEGCAILIFENDLGEAAREWTESLRKGARAVRALVGREVFVFPSVTVMEPWVKQAPWQGTYLVLLKPNTVLCATSDRYLESVLRRVDQAPEVRALPDGLPEWKHVDFDAPAWMLRHVPRSGNGSHPIGVTAAFTRDRFRLVYVPRSGSNIDLGPLKEEWYRVLDPSRRDLLKIVRRPDGTVVLACGARLGEETLWFAWQLDRLQAFELFLGAR
jgi:hypothetical protein